MSFRGQDKFDALVSSGAAFIGLMLSLLLCSMLSSPNQGAAILQTIEMFIGDRKFLPVYPVIAPGLGRIT